MKSRISEKKRDLNIREEPGESAKNPPDSDEGWPAKGQEIKKKEFKGYKVQVVEIVSEESVEKGKPAKKFVSRE